MIIELGFEGWEVGNKVEMGGKNVLGSGISMCKFFWGKESRRDWGREWEGVWDKMRLVSRVL